MKTVQLKRLPSIDLNERYAMQLENGNYRHFTIPLYARMNGANPTDLVVKWFRDQGEEVAIETTDADMITGNPMIVNLIKKDMFTKEFQNSTLKALLRQKYKTMIEWSSAKSLKVRIALAVNAVVHKINAAIARTIGRLMPNKLVIGYADKMSVESKAFLRKEYEEIQKLDGGAFFTDSSVVEGGIAAPHVDGKIRPVVLVRLLPLIKVDVESVANFTVNFAVTFGEEDLERAVNMLASDLTILADKGLVRGSLIPPSLVQVNNTIGNGKKVYIAVAVPMLDSQKLKDLGIEQPSNKQGLESLAKVLGVKLAVPEGASNYLDGKLPYSDLVEETIDLAPQSRQEIAQAVADGFAQEQAAIKAFNENKRRAEQEKKTEN